MAGGSADLTFRARLIDEISSPVQRIRKSLGDAGRAGKVELGQNLATGADRASKSVGAVGRSSSIAAGSIRGAEKATGDLNRKLDTGTAKSGPGFIGMLGRLGAAVGIAGLAKLGLDTAATAEQMQVSFTTLMKSSTRAKDETEWLKTQAAATPFELADLTKADRTLLGFGMTSDKVRRDFLLGMGDMASAVGVSAAEFPELAKVFGQVHAAGKLQTQDMMQLVNYGVSYDTVAKSMGMSVAELRDGMSKGTVTAGQFEAGMSKAFKTDYAGGMAAQSQTFNGVLSTFKDNVSQSLSKMFEPLLPYLKTALENAGKAIEDFAKNVPGWVAGAKQKLEEFGKSAEWQSMIDAGKWVVQNKDAVSSAFIGIASAVTVYKTAVWLAALNQKLLNWEMKANVFGLVIAGIAALVAGLVWFFTQTETGRQMWANFTSFLSTAWDNTKNAIIGGINAVKEWLSTLWGDINRFKDNIIGWKDTVVAKFGEIATAVGAKIDEIVQFFKELPGRALSAVGNMASDLADAITPDDLTPWDSGDTVMSHASGAGGLGNTLGAYGAISSSIGATPGISNMLIGGGGTGRGSGDHQAGRALDLVGSASTLLAFRKAAQLRGGFAEFHGTGPRRHLHFVPPAGGSRLGGGRLSPGGIGDTTGPVSGGPGIVVQQVTIYATDGTDAADRFLDRLKRVRQDALERG